MDLGYVSGTGTYPGVMFANFWNTRYRDMAKKFKHGHMNMAAKIILSVLQTYRRTLLICTCYNITFAVAELGTFILALLKKGCVCV